MDHESEVERIQREIADLQPSWPGELASPHSVPVSMWQNLELLEEALERAMKSEDEKDSAG